jgi:hypothetical protein
MSTMPETGEIHTWERDDLRAAVIRVDTKHRAWRAWTFVPCTRHQGPWWRRDIVKCADCTRGVISSCTNPRCGSWPCDTHLDLHGETRGTCTHRAGEHVLEVS